MNKSLPPDDAMIVNEPGSDTAAPSTWPMASVDDIAVLPHNEDDWELSL